MLLGLLTGRFAYCYLGWRVTRSRRDTLPLSECAGWTCYPGDIYQEVVVEALSSAGSSNCRTAGREWADETLGGGQDDAAKGGARECEIKGCGGRQTVADGLIGGAETKRDIIGQKRSRFFPCGQSGTLATLAR